MDSSLLASTRRDASLSALRVTALAACVLAMGIAVDSRAQTAAPKGQPPGMQAASTQQKQDVFSKEELAQALAPVALYPDALLAQVLMASTYPGDVADAAKWSKAHPDTKGDDAVKGVANEDWDPSVQALVAFPQVVLMLGHDIDWTQKLGDAFLAQPDDVMNVVQELRAKAKAAGNLKTNEHQKVSEEAATGTVPQTIIIESSEPEKIYVPTYDPGYMYGPWGYPGYPPYYYPPSAYWYPGAALAGGIMWGIGIGIAGGLWGDCNWGGGDININSQRYNNFERNVDRERGDRGNRSDRVANRENNNGKFQHDSSRRDGVPYRDQGSREKFGNRQPGAENRAGFRGDDPARAQSRDQARQSMQRQGMEPARNNQQARDRANTASRDPRSSQMGGNSYRQSGANNMGSRDAARSQYGSGGARDNAFSGAGNSGASRAASNRGSSSRSGASRSSGAGRSMSRPSRGGGGGRRR